MKTVLKFFWHRKKISLALIIIIILLNLFIIPQTQTNIETQKINRKDLTQSVITSGKIESETSVKLGFLIGGKVVYVGANKGDYVKKWQTLAGLDTRTVQKNLQNSLTDYMKQRNSFDDTIENNLNRTPAQALNEDMKRVLLNNQYDLEKSVVSVELLSIAKEQSYLTSPIDGIVLSSDVNVPGINAVAGNGFVIADPVNVVFKIEVDEADIGKVKIGTPVKIMLESFPDKDINLKITKIEFASHTSSNGGNVFDVEAKLPENSDSGFKIGMTGDAEIIFSKKTGVLTVPLGSIFDTNYVYVKKGDVFEKRKIVLGIQSDTDREVVYGLNAGDEIAAIPDEVDKMQENKKKFIIF